MSVETGFQNPGTEYHSVPKWVWNASSHQMNAASMRAQLQQFRDHDGYGGVMIVPWFMDDYMTETYFEKYGLALDCAAELGMQIILWDENGFPTGSAGGLLEQTAPDHVAHRLDLTVWEKQGPAVLDEPVPAGTLMGVVAVNDETGQREDITPAVDNTGRLRHRLPNGHWKVMLFTCVPEGPSTSFRRNHRLVDYLEANAVSTFIRLTHQQYYDHFPSHFGTTIQYAFYDEPSFWHVQGGRIWTPAFNRKFEERFGYNPTIHYPALWFDVGEETEAARNALFGFRAELYATGFVKTLADWCRGHRIQLTGHMDQEEIVNPASLHGDLLKVFEHQDMPGVDEIGTYGRGSKAYKLVSSAANNYDKPRVMCEVYGAMGEEMPVDVLHREAMDLYAKGVNFTVPHGTWYDNRNDVTFPPELSYRSEKFGPALPAYNLYVARLSSLLQGGRHVADIGVLYPVAALQAGYRFGEGDAYRGGVITPEANYLDVGEWLSLKLRRDFTYIHPEVLDGRCEVAGPEIALRNEHNHEHYQVFVLTGSRVVHWSNVEKLRKFYAQGGKLIALGQLPYRSAEFGHDRDVENAIAEIFEVQPRDPDTGGEPLHVASNAAGGKACYLPDATPEAVKQALNDCQYTVDVEFEEDLTVAGGNLTYLHKINEGRHLYFVANSSDTAVDTHVRLSGKHALSTWDPHTGEEGVPEYRHLESGNQWITRVRIDLPPIRSLFLVADA